MTSKQVKELKHFSLILFIILIFVIQITFFLNTFAAFMSMMMPLFIGIIIAFLLHRIMQFYERALHNLMPKIPLKMKRFFAIVLAYATFLFFLILIVNIIVPEVIESIRRFAANFNTYLANFEQFSQRVLTTVGYEGTVFNELGKAMHLDGLSFDELIRRFLNFMTPQISRALPNLFSLTTSFIANVITLFIAIFISIYLLIDKEKILKLLKRLILVYGSEAMLNKTQYVGQVVVDTFNRYVVGQLLEACILGTLCFIGMKGLGILNIYHFDYALLISVLVGVTALVPILGAYVGGGIAFLLLALISPWQAFVFLVYLIILQQLENNLIYPYVVGNSVGLPPLLVMLAIIIAGAAFGFFGMLVAVPVTSVIYTLIKHDMDEREKAVK